MHFKGIMAYRLLKKKFVKQQIFSDVILFALQNNAIFAYEVLLKPGVINFGKLYLNDFIYL
jgi:hypothetical protein